MPLAPIPPDECERLETLKEYAILDKSSEPEFEGLIELAAQICDAPIALISVVDSTRLWFKARHGLEIPEISRDDSFCAYAVASRETLIVEDATKDPRFAELSAVSGVHGIRFYAGAPLLAPSGHALGTLCVVDQQPRQLTAKQRNLLEVLSRQVMTQLELRRHSLDKARTETALLGILEDQMQAEQQVRRSEVGLARAQRIAHLGSWELDLATEQLTCSDEMFNIFGLHPTTADATLAMFTSAIHPEDEVRFLTAFQIATTGGPGLDIEHRIQRSDGTVRWLRDVAELAYDSNGKPVRLSGTSLDITERKCNEETLREQAQLLASAQRVGRMGTWNVEIPTGRVYWSDSTCLLFGIRPEEFGGTFEDFYSFLIPEDRIALDQERARAFAEGRSIEAEYRIRRPDGQIRWMYTRGDVELDAAGKAVRRSGVVMDVTEKRESREQMAQAAALLRIAGKAARLGGWIVSIADKTVTFSEVTAEICGESPGFSPTVRRALRYFPRKSRETIIAAFSQCSRDGTPFDVETQIRTSNGSTVWVRGVGEAVRNSAGEITHIQGAMQDITRMKKAESQIAEQAALIDNAHDAIHVRDLEHRITYWNKGAERLYGWRADEAIGRSARELFFTDPTAFDQATKRIQTKGEWLGELVKTGKDGRQLTIEGRWTLVRDESGKPRGVLAINTDITERKKLEQQFLRAQRMESIGTLAGGIAHDLNNVLAPIIMSLDLLHMNAQDSASQELLSVVGASARRGAEMVSQVLSFARGVEGQRLTIQVKHLLQDIEKIANDTFLKHIQVRTLIPSDLWMIMGDPTQLHQVLLNLCVNARDAMPNGGTLIISAENRVIDQQYAGLEIEANAGPHIFLQVEDSGTGIPPEIMEKIFDPFFTTKEIGKGTGLGLSTSMGIVKSHGGFFRVYSEVGRGTKFQVYLPAQTEASEATVSTEAVELPRGEDELVLVVDDEASVRQVTQQTLEAFGYRVIVAADGAEAVALFARRNAEISIVLTDMMMPVLDGPAMIQVLRKMNPSLPVVAASGLTANGTVAQAANIGVKHFLPKPYGAATLLKTLKQALAGN